MRPHHPSPRVPATALVRAASLFSCTCTIFVDTFAVVQTDKIGMVQQFLRLFELCTRRKSHRFTALKSARDSGLHLHACAVLSEAWSHVLTVLFWECSENHDNESVS